MKVVQFHVPDNCKGQIVEFAYAQVGEVLVRRVTDQSIGKVHFSVVTLESSEVTGIGWIDKTGMSNFEPIVRSDRWKSIPLEEALALIEEKP